MKLNYIDSLGNISLLNVNSLIFTYIYNKNLVYQLVIYYRSNFRLGNRSQKNRSEVKHSTKKLYKQKGTGKARAGMTSSPIRRGGGRAFPSLSFENFTKKFNKKMYRISLCIIYSYIIKNNQLSIVDDFFLIIPRTKVFINKFNFINLHVKSVLLTCKIDKKIFLASRNLLNFSIINLNKINPLILLQYSLILITKSSVEYIGNKLLL